MIPFIRKTSKTVAEEEMQRIYSTIKTPIKHGAVIKWNDFFTDSPSVFLYKGHFYMYFVAISKDTSNSGYETHLAKSSDLLHWDYIGPIFCRNEENHWDSKQCAAYVAFPEIKWGKLPKMQTVNGKYFVSYLAGNSDGYEPDPLFMGLAQTSDPIEKDAFIRFPNPILSPNDPDRRPFEEKTLYKSYLFYDPLLSTGYPYVNCYNARSNQYTERIFLAVSNDGIHWERYGDRAVVDLITNHPGEVICGDPQIILMGDTYVMLFFRWRDGGKAYNTFAASKNLVDWTIWKGTPLIESEYPWENQHAHKSWFLNDQGKNYHFYCAVNTNNERFIALATN